MIIRYVISISSHCLPHLEFRPVVAITLSDTMSLSYQPLNTKLFEWTETGWNIYLPADPLRMLILDAELSHPNIKVVNEDFAETSNTRK